MDDVITHGDTTDEVLELKTTTITIFRGAGFELHHCHSNESELTEEGETCDDKQSFTKEQLGVKLGETKFL